MDYINRIAAVFTGAVYILTIYEFISTNFGKNISLLSWIVVLIMYAPLFYFINKNGYKYYLESKSYLQGRKGEYSIYFELLNLPDSYFVFQDVKLPGKDSNIDFVVVGPNGVFTIEVKSHKGIIGFNGIKLVRNGVPIKEKDFLKQAMMEALDLHSYLMDGSGIDQFVFPLLVFSSNKAIVKFGFKPVQNVYVIKKGFLLNAISGCKGKLSPDVIDRYKIELLKLVYPNRKNSKLT